MWVCGGAEVLHGRARRFVFAATETWTAPHTRVSILVPPTRDCHSPRTYEDFGECVSVKVSGSSPAVISDDTRRRITSQNNVFRSISYRTDLNWVPRRALFPRVPLGRKLKTPYSSENRKKHSECISVSVCMESLTTWTSLYSQSRVSNLSPRKKIK